jgi:hypothetical protein
MTHNDLPEIPIETIAETESYTVWAADEPDGERTFHLELGPVTVHFFREEWTEFVRMVREAARLPEQAGADSGDDEASGAEIELDWGSLSFDDEEWTEFLRLLEQV